MFRYAFWIKQGNFALSFTVHLALIIPLRGRAEGDGSRTAVLIVGVDKRESTGSISIICPDIYPVDSLNTFDVLLGLSSHFRINQPVPPRTS